MDEFAFQAEGLVKRFGKITALAGVDLHARPGTVLSVLGPNGAGKTTAIRILATLTSFDEGTVRVGGLDVIRDAARVRRLIGLTGQYATLDEELTGLGNLVLIGRLLDLRKPDAVQRAKELLEQFGLSDAAHKPVAAYSGGMRRRLDLAASLVGRPRLLFLDEPSVGLDPGRREELWWIIRKLTTDGASVLLTTQYLEEADALADEITVIDKGRVVAHGTPPELKQRVGSQSIAARPRDPERTEDAVHVLATVSGHAVEQANRHELVVPVDNDRAVFDVARRFEEQDITLAEFSLRLPSLEEVFFALTGAPCNAPDTDHRQHQKEPGMTDTTPPATFRSTHRRPFALLRHSLILAGRSLTKSARNPGVLINGVVTPTIFLLIFVYLFGASVAVSTDDYLHYLFPGIVVMGAGLSGMLSSGLSINIDMKKGVFDRFRSLPIGRSTPLLGSILADIIHYIVAIALLFGIGYLMGFRVQTDPGSAIAAVALVLGFGFCLSWITVFLGVLVHDEGAVMSFAFIVFIPLMLGTSLAAPVDTLPGWLQAWANINPVTHAMDASRALLSDTPADDSIAQTIIWSAIILIVACPLAIAAYSRRR